MPELQGYSDLTRIGRGGMATVYRGRQTSLNRAVAIKFLSAEHLWDAQSRALFDQESLVIAQLNHPNIIHVIDRGFTAGERPYFVMEYVEGQDLGEKLRAGGVSVTARVMLMMQVCDGLAYAHHNGVIHRDIKPSNLMVDGRGHLKILDFGIAWLDSQGQPDGEAIYGTPDYMSPEQFTSPDAVTHLADIYSLGAVMYEVFVGSKHRDDVAGWEAALEQLPAALADLVRSCLASDPAQRPASAEAVRLQLLRLLRGAHIGETQKQEARAAFGKAIGKFALLDVLHRDPRRGGAAYLFEDAERKQLLVIRKRLRSKAGIAEAQALAAVRHPNLVEILGSSSNARASIVVMRHLPGGALGDRLSRPYAGDRFVRLALQICAGMQAAHERGIVHGNLHPGNVLFDRKGNARIADFGSEPSPDGEAYRPRNRGEASAERDRYAAAAIFHRLLSGEALDFAHRRVQAGPGFDGLDSRLQKLLRDMLESDSDEYLGDFAAVSARLESLKGKLPDPLLAGRRRRRRRAGLIVAAAAVIATGAAAYALYYFDPERWRQLWSQLAAWMG